ncbi:MAG: hypothetical protein QOH81_3434 [Sphingomonadales bacterium]|nr:hypothetical protein [Sphingomonadales bacterium]
MPLLRHPFSQFQQPLYTYHEPTLPVLSISGTQYLTPLLPASVPAWVTSASIDLGLESVGECPSLPGQWDSIKDWSGFLARRHGLPQTGPQPSIRYCVPGTVRCVLLSETSSPAYKGMGPSSSLKRLRADFASAGGWAYINYAMSPEFYDCSVFTTSLPSLRYGHHYDRPDATSNIGKCYFSARKMHPYLPTLGLAGRERNADLVIPNFPLACPNDRAALGTMSDPCPVGQELLCEIYIVLSNFWIRRDLVSAESLQYFRRVKARERALLRFF